MRKLKNYIPIIAFLGILYFFSIGNFIKLHNSFFAQFDRCNINTFTAACNKAEDTYKNSFVGKNMLVDFYGIVQNALGKNIIGNFEFIRDNNGSMHRYTGQQDNSKFCSDMTELNKRLESAHTPLLYVQNPAREIKNYTTFFANVQMDGNAHQDTLAAELKKDNINILDMRQEIEKQRFNPNSIYLRTDVHMTTEGELWTLKNIINELEQKYSLNFTNKEQSLDLKNYTVKSEEFLGNLSRSSGRFYSGLDRFNLYIPNFPTAMSLYNPTGNISKSGSFENVIMNGAENNLDGNYLNYWVTNYLQYPSPYYEITNNKVNSNKILIIMDSMGIRTASYLSLMVNKLTVIDPRFRNDSDYISKALLNTHYDAVIVLQGESTTLVPNGLFPETIKNPKAEIVSTDTPSQVEKGKMYNINIKVKNTGTEDWNSKYRIQLCIFQNGKDYGYRIPLPDGLNIKPGEEYTFVLQNFHMASENSAYLEYQMVERDNYFGQKKRVDITAR